VKPGGACGRIADALSEMEDEEWEVPEHVQAATRDLSREISMTGQPIIGQAYADSVTRSLFVSTLVSWVALALVLVPGRQLRALAPATWTLAVTAGIIALLGHPIGVGTSMVSCIAIGSGVDFAIHLGVRARAIGGADAGRRATDEIGNVALVTGVQLALAFLVLVASEMPPLREFGVGLAIGLVGAAAGAVWLTPRLWRSRA
jgi:predicted RND superfamily exporter protein